MSTVRLLIADVDGTLLTEAKVLTQRARNAVQELRAAGIAFAVTSGRPPRGMSMLIGPLGLTTPIAAFNGGMLVHPDLTPIEAHTIAPSVVAPIMDTLARHSLDVWVYRGAEWFVRHIKGSRVDREQQTVCFAPTQVDTFEGLHDGVVKIVGVSDDLALVARCEEEMRERLGDHVSAARSQPYYLDVTHPDANKGSVVRRLSTLLAVPTEQIASIGDMPNDVLMFSLSGLSIAMGNASRDVQRTARRVTLTNENEGFAKAVERYVLRGRASVSTRNGAVLM